MMMMIRTIALAVALSVCAVQADARCFLILCFASASGSHRHHHFRSTVPTDPAFCADVQAAFNEKSPGDLAKYVDSIPRYKRAEASRCLDFWVRP